MFSKYNRKDYENLSIKRFLDKIDNRPHYSIVGRTVRFYGKYHYNGGAYRTVSTKAYDVSSKKASALIDDIRNPDFMF
jgi:hypothetical protein